MAGTTLELAARPANRPDVRSMQSSNTSLGDTRRRLLDAAVTLFAERGYHDTSTRDICRLAGANSAAVHYHFGDKANLYREVFRFGLHVEGEDVRAFGALPRRASLLRFYRGLLASRAGSALHQQLLRLHAREEVQPSGVLGVTVVAAIGARHTRFTAFLVRELGLREADLDVERLALALVGMGFMFYHLRHLVAELAPALTGGPGWADTMSERLADYATALIDAEASRRARAAVEATL